MKKTARLLFKVLVITGLIPLAAAGCGSKKENHAPAAAGMPGKMPVPAAHPLIKKITDWDEYTGRFRAVERVEIRSRVSGLWKASTSRPGRW